MNRRTPVAASGAATVVMVRKPAAAWCNDPDVRVGVCIGTIGGKHLATHYAGRRQEHETFAQLEERLRSVMEDYRASCLAAGGWLDFTPPAELAQPDEIQRGNAGIDGGTWTGAEAAQGDAPLPQYPNPGDLPATPTHQAEVADPFAALPEEPEGGPDGMGAAEVACTPVRFFGGPLDGQVLRVRATLATWRHSVALDDGRRFQDAYYDLHAFRSHDGAERAMAGLLRGSGLLPTLPSVRKAMDEVLYGW